jgi:Tol biopolymer transport system component
MRIARAASWVTVLAVVAGWGAAPVDAAPAGHTIRVDVSTGGAVGNGNADTSGLAISANGRFIAFSSSATNLVAGDTNGMRDVFVRNLRAGTTMRVDLGAGGVQANGDSFGPLAISGDGRFVAFESDSSNLAPGSGCVPGQGGDCLFVRDRANPTTRVVKRIQNPQFVALSEHGRYLVTAATVGQVVRIDLHTGARVRVSCCNLGSDLKNLSFGGMSANANLVTFGVNAGASGGNPALEQVYVRNIARARTTMVSRAASGVVGNGESFAGGISPGGRYVIFSSTATNLVPGDTNGHMDVFVRDRRRGTTSRVDVGPRRAQANGDGQALAISAGGRYRVFASTATNLVRSDTNHADDIFVHDRLAGRTFRIDLTAAGGQANHGVGALQDSGFAMTPGGRWAVFASRSTNMVSPSVNAFEHVYLRGPLF